jgi:hypothetical protein
MNLLLILLPLDMIKVRKRTQEKYSQPYALVPTKKKKKNEKKNKKKRYNND